jgi:predicted TIM-barrel fold metal-dependent hydrolase
MIIDINTYIGHWPFRQVACGTPEDLVNLMDEAGIDKACVSNINAIFYRNVQDGNEELVRQISSNKRFKDRLILFAIINPSYPGWKKDFMHCIDDLGMKGLELYPAYHQYNLASENAVELLNMAAEKSIPVHLPCAIENVRQRHWLDTKEDLSADNIAQALPLCSKTDFIITNGPSPDIANKLMSLSQGRQGKIYYDFSRVDLLYYRFDNFVKSVGADNVVFGSVMPLQYADTQFAKLHFSKISNEDKEKILYKNLKKLLKL